MKYCGGEHGVIIAVKTRRAHSPSLLLSSIKHQLIYERPDGKEGMEGKGTRGETPSRPVAISSYIYSATFIQWRSVIYSPERVGSQYELF